MAHHGRRGRGRVGRPWRRVRAEVLAQSDVCALCGLPGADTVDHKIPLILGGDPLDRDNLQPAHHSCNSRKGKRLTAPRRTTSRRW
ncbi:MAG TPA: HNH endonuclease signature motif containing protein [Mycobacteriales bacterium]|jgi:HNH endonuclease.